jgi:hypothetical protein
MKPALEDRIKDAHTQAPSFQPCTHLRKQRQESTATQRGERLREGINLGEGDGGGGVANSEERSMISVAFFSVFLL